MIEKGRISSLQVALLLHPTILATGILLVPAVMAKYAGRDLWISPIWSSFVGFFTVYLAVQLHHRHPQQTPIQYSQTLLGPVIGKGIGLLFLLFYLHVNGTVLREYAEFVTNIYLPHTPLVVILGVMTWVCALAVRGGVEGLARTAQILIPLAFSGWALLILFSVPDWYPERIFPVMEHGVIPSIKGAVIPQGWCSEFFLLAFFLPLLVDREKAMKWGMLTVLAVMIPLVVLALIATFIFGDTVAHFPYPIMEVVRYIGFGEFFEHLDALLLLIWIMGVFIKIAVFFYALTLGTAQWLRLSDYRPIVFPLGLLQVVFGVWTVPNFQTLMHHLGTTGPFYLTAVQTGIPLGLWFLSLLKRRSPKEKRAA